MRYLIVFAHPEPRSLNGFLRDHAVAALGAAGHEVDVADLYAMKFKAVADAGDFSDFDSDRLVYHAEAARAYDAGSISDDIAREHARLRVADAVILQFPLWWFGIPAILKGWIDRVFCSGFAIGVPRSDGPGWQRYGSGPLLGERAMVAVSTGAREQHLGPRGVHGPLQDLLFPLLHGVLHYAGATVVEPLPVFGAAHLTPEGAQAAATRYAARLLDIGNAPAIPFRNEQDGGYARGVLIDPSATDAGFRLHLAVGRSASDTDSDG